MSADPVELWFLRRYGPPPGAPPRSKEEPGSPEWHERERQLRESDRLDGDSSRWRNQRWHDDWQRRELERRRLDRRY